jgi:hypothetical protein
MAPTGQIVGKEHIARVEDAFGAVAQANFRLTLQGDDVLASRGDVKVLKIAHWRTAELNAGGPLHCSPLGFGNLLVRKLKFFQM